MKWLVAISSSDPETMFNAPRLANTASKHGTETSVFMLGGAVDCEALSSAGSDLVAQVEEIQEGGDFYV